MRNDVVGLERIKEGDVMPLRSQSGVPTHVLTTLDSLRCGGFLLDSRGQVLSFNLLALGCLGDGLNLGGGHLSAVDRATDQGLQYIIRAAQVEQDDRNIQKTVTVRRSTRLPLVARIVRLMQDSPQLSFLLLLILDPELWPEPSHEMLSQAFGLTRAEAEIAIGIASGRTLAKIAVDRCIKVGTVRAHLKMVFSKTCTRSQADLTRVLTRLAFLVSHTERKAAGGGSQQAGKLMDQGSTEGRVEVDS